MTNDIDAEVQHWRDCYPEDQHEYTDHHIAAILRREHQLHRRRLLFTRAQTLWLAVLGTLIGCSQIAQGVAAVLEATR